MTEDLYYVGPHSDKDEGWHIERLLSLPNPWVSVDTETVSLTDKTCIGIGIGLSPQESYYFPVLPKRSIWLDLAISFTSNKDRVKLYHNGNFDIQVLRQLSEDTGTESPDCDNLADSAILARVQGLKAELDYIGKSIGVDNLFTIQDLLAEAKVATGKANPNMLDVDIERVATKCGNDVRATWVIWEYVQSRADAVAWDNYNVDIECYSNLKYIETKGFKLDRGELKRKHDDIAHQVETYRTVCANMGFNPGSPKEVGYILASRGHQLPMTKGKRKQLRTDEDTLLGINDPIASMVLAYRGANKLLGTYIKPYLGIDRAYTHFRIDLSTGRLASFEVNLQNVPPDMRTIYDPDSGDFTWADISQLEMRAFAYISGDPVMLDAYANGQSIHRITQAALWPTEINQSTYDRSKTFNFSMIFDAMDKTMAKKTGLSQQLAGKYKGEWLQLYNVGAAWMRTQANLETDIVEDVYGRKMLIPEYSVKELWPGKYGDNSKHRATCRINYPVQGTGANIVKRGINWLCRNGYREAYRLQVHDEHILDGVIDFPKDLDNLGPFATPHEVKVGPKWT